MAELKPARVFEQFAKINHIPRPSKHEEQMIAYLKKFGEDHGLETLVDETGNVLIRKPATKGYENRPTTILQSHMDMVCDKLVDVDFDFHKDAIQTYVDGEWLHAKGTTLGADDGIGDAIELAILDSDDIEHGPLECVFTVDEETSLGGAIGMKPGFMTGKYLVNLDSEEEGQIFISCAGGMSTKATFRFQREEAPKGYFFFEGTLKGLKGGHSGDDIEKKRANAIKILARFLYMEQNKTDLRLAWNIFSKDVEDEFHVTDVNMVWSLQSAEAQKVLPKEVSRKLIAGLQALDNGVFAICQDPALNDMVETSSNVASVKTTDDSIVFVASHRSNVTSNLRNMANTVRATFELAGAEVEQGSGYPAWKMNPNSKMVKVAVDAYKKLFHKDPVVRGIHAGLECGLFSEKYPELDMVSFGPTLRHVHTPDECLHIPTVQMVWDHLLEILKNIPEE